MLCQLWRGAVCERSATADVKMPLNVHKRTLRWQQETEAGRAQTVMWAELLWKEREEGREKKNEEEEREEKRKGERKGERKEEEEEGKGGERKTGG